MPASFEDAVRQLRSRPEVVAVRVPDDVFRRYAMQMADLWPYQPMQRMPDWFGLGRVLLVGRQAIASMDTPWPVVRRALGR